MATSSSQHAQLLLGLPLVASLCACGGGIPLLHPAQPLGKGDVSLGAGLSSQPVLLALPTSDSVPQVQATAALNEHAIAPAFAPWVGARIGILGDNEAGITYSGRMLRLDGRHAFTLSKRLALSVGLGGDVLLAGRPNNASETSTFKGGGLDLPVLLGWMSTGGLYAGWIGPRLGINFLRGEAQLEGTTAPSRLSGRDVHAGLVAGLRLGFRHVHVALEIAGDWHGIAGKVGEQDVTFNQISLTPAGAIITSF